MMARGVDAAARKRAEANIAKARTRDSGHALGKLTTIVDGERRIISDPPLIEPIEELVEGAEHEQIMEELRVIVRGYRSTLQSDRRHLLENYRLVHAARKVVGVGSVGTRAWILLLMGRDDSDPLFLQAKEANPSVMEEFVGSSRAGSHAERVVHGQHLMQASSDIFLGWQSVEGRDGVQRDFYIRQLRDWKGSAIVETMNPTAWRCTENCAAGRWPGRTPVPAIAWRSPRTSAARTCSTERSPSSPSSTRTRPNVTTTRWSPPSRTAGSPSQRGL